VEGSLEACLAAAGPGLPYAVFQTAIRPGSTDFAEIGRRAGREVAIIGHSVYGVAGTKASLLARLRKDAAARTRFAACGYGGDDLESAIGDLLLDAALAGNPAGVTLVSMFDAAHLARNTERASGRLCPEATQLLDELADGA
jgi:hypothetical protein